MIPLINKQYRCLDNFVQVGKAPDAYHGDPYMREDEIVTVRSKTATRVRISSTYKYFSQVMVVTNKQFKQHFRRIKE